MRRISRCIAFASLFASLVEAPSAFASDAPAPVKLFIKPLLCVLDKEETSCAVTFDIRWKSPQPGEYCLNDSVQPTPLHCWPRAQSGQVKQERIFSEDFRYWLSLPAGTEALTEVKIEVLRVGSGDRRRERRARHVWDVL